MKATRIAPRRQWWAIAMPTALCIVTTGFAALMAPTWWVIAVASASTVLCIAGAAAGDFGIIGWSGAAAAAACVASLVENRPVYWGEPTLMSIGILAMLEIGHIVCIMRTREVNPSSFVQPHVDTDNGSVDHVQPHNPAAVHGPPPGGLRRRVARAHTSVSGLRDLRRAARFRCVLHDATGRRRSRSVHVLARACVDTGFSRIVANIVTR